jgi:hypothetical protein
MNLLKIDTMLALAFQESNGPITIVAKLQDGSILTSYLTKNKILELSNKDWITGIKIATRLKNRRKSERAGYKDRRWDNATIRL